MATPDCRCRDAPRGSAPQKRTQNWIPLFFGGNCFFNLIDVDGRVVLSDQISLGSLGFCLGSCLDRLGCLDAALVVWVVWVVWVVCVLVLENTLQSN